MKIDIPIVAEKKLYGTTIVVIAARYGLIRTLAKAKTEEERHDKIAEIVDACCSCSDGSDFSADELLPNDVMILAELAIGGNKSDFPNPPA